MRLKPPELPSWLELLPLTDRQLPNQSIVTTHPDLHQKKNPAGDSRHPGSPRRSAERNRPLMAGFLVVGHCRACSSHGRNPLLATSTPGSENDGSRTRDESRADSPERSGAPARIDTLAGWLAGWLANENRLELARSRSKLSLLPAGTVLSSSSGMSVVLAAQDDLLTRGFDVDGFSAPKITAEPCLPSCRARKLVERERG